MKQALESVGDIHGLPPMVAAGLRKASIESLEKLVAMSRNQLLLTGHFTRPMLQQLDDSLLQLGARLRDNATADMTPWDYFRTGEIQEAIKIEEAAQKSRQEKRR